MPRLGSFAKAAALTLVVAAAFALWQWLAWPDVAALRTTLPRSTAFIDDFKERAAASGGRPPLRWTPVPLARISPALRHAVVAAEDMGFFGHKGFEVAEIKASIKEAWEEGEAPRGASTLTQQLAKNLWLSPSRNPWRKVKEALLTRALERDLGKLRILELYLNVVEFGPGIYGAEAASRHYFGIPAASLSTAQAAQLAAALPRPSSWHPGVETKGYRNYVAIIRGRMEKSAWLRAAVGGSGDAGGTAPPAAVPDAPNAPDATATAPDAAVAPPGSGPDAAGGGSPPATPPPQGVPSAR